MIPPAPALVVDGEEDWLISRFEVAEVELVGGFGLERV